MVHEACEGQWRATVRVQRWQPGAKTTEVEARMALVCVSTKDNSRLTGDANSIWTVVDGSSDRVVSGSGPCIYHKCQKFSS